MERIILGGKAVLIAIVCCVVIYWSVRSIAAILI